MRHTVTLLVLGLVFVLPALVLILVSLAPGWRFPNVWPDHFSFRGITYLVRHHRQIFTALGSSFLFSLLTVLTTLPMCLVPAAVFARSMFRGRALLEGLLLTPALVPP